MGIDIYMAWENQTQAEKKKQFCWFDTTIGHVGYLREAYHGEPYATKYLVREAFEAENCHASISAAKLKERLPRTLELVEEREKAIYKSDSKDIEEIKQSFSHFVALAEKKEKETGKPVEIWAWY